jgi:hypothetical protein
MARHSRSNVRGADQYSGRAETLARPRTPPPEAGLGAADPDRRVLIGLMTARRYDRAGRDRLDPDLLAYVHHSADEYRASRG